VTKSRGVTGLRLRDRLPAGTRIRTACKSCAGGTAGNGVRRRSPCPRQAKNLSGLILTRRGAWCHRQARRPTRLLSFPLSRSRRIHFSCKNRGSRARSRRIPPGISAANSGSGSSAAGTPSSAAGSPSAAAGSPSSAVGSPSAAAGSPSAAASSPGPDAAQSKAAAERAHAIHEARLAQENTLISAAQWDEVIQDPDNYEGDIYTISGTVTEYNINSNTLATQESAALVAVDGNGNDFVVEAPASVLGDAQPGDTFTAKVTVLGAEEAQNTVYGGTSEVPDFDASTFTVTS
jgi:hypothetical protein